MPFLQNIWSSRRSSTELPRQQQNYYYVVENFDKRHLADSEKAQRLNQLLCQARVDASNRDKLHREELSGLYNKLNSLQTAQNTLSDEQILDQMRRLNQRLEFWIKSCFKDQAKLAGAIQPAEDGFPRNRPQTYAWIQASITGLVYDSILTPYLFGIPDAYCGHFCKEVEASIQENCSEVMFQSWRVATSFANEHLGMTNHQAIFADIMYQVEHHLGSHSSVEDKPRQQQLRDLLEKCANFKHTLSRQPDMLRFYCSRIGEDFSEHSMTVVGGDREKGKVRFCLWPGLIKRTYDGSEQVLEQELVWTMR
ncbi:hypothetical protein BDV12DRAFT_191302 [Aspergillus spectabilis]